MKPRTQLAYEIILALSIGTVSILAYIINGPTVFHLIFIWLLIFWGLSKQHIIYLIMRDQK
jgi:hypothetical protein